MPTLRSANVAKPSLNDNKAEGPDSTQTTTSDQANASASSPGVAEDVSITQPTTSDQANAAGDSSSVVEGGETADTTPGEIYGPVRYLDTIVDDGEIYGPVRNLTPQANITVNIHLNQKLTNFATAFDPGVTPQTETIPWNTQDPIFLSTNKFFAFAGDTVTYGGDPTTIKTTTTVNINGAASTVTLANLNASTAKLKKYGSNISNWYVVAYNTTGGYWQGWSNVNLAATQLTMQYKKTQFSDWHAYPTWLEGSKVGVIFKNFKNESGILNGGVEFSNTQTQYLDRIEWIDCPPTPNPVPANYNYYASVDTTKKYPLPKTGCTLADFLDGIYDIYGSTDNFVTG